MGSGVSKLASTVLPIVVKPIESAVGGVIKDVAGNVASSAASAITGGGSTPAAPTNNAASAPAAGAHTLLAAPPSASKPPVPKPTPKLAAPKALPPQDAVKTLKDGVDKIASYYKDHAPASKTPASKTTASKATASKTSKPDDKEAAIAKQFIEHTLEVLREATFEQFNLLIVTDSEKDEWWKGKKAPEGQLLPVPTIDIQVAPGKTRTYKVYSFDTGTYIRNGSHEADQLIYFGGSKNQKEPMTGGWHIEFNEARPKKNPADLKKFVAEHNKANKGAKNPAGKSAKAGKKEEESGEEEEPASGEEEEEEGSEAEESEPEDEDEPKSKPSKKAAPAKKAPAKGKK